VHPAIEQEMMAYPSFRFYRYSRPNRASVFPY
jgi:hypothetical protein